MGILKVGAIDINNAMVVQQLQRQIQTVLDNDSNYFQLEHTNRYHFSVTNGSLPSKPGWYIILNNITPLYVGQAENLDARLNTDNGSRDQYGNPKRSSDPGRNLIKKYRELRLIPLLRVCILQQSHLFPMLTLSPLDIGNVEKHISIWRCMYKYK